MTLKSHAWAYIQRKMAPKDTCTPMFIAALFIYNGQDMETT